MKSTKTGPTPYDLPEGKEYHIFIACSGEDSDTGKWLLEQLESRYPMRCVYHERDFQPGVMIVDNMRDYIDKSVKSLLLISNGFIQSYHCKLEETFAISLSNETGQNLIIPVLLEDVPLPNVLRHMTYVDARPNAQGDVVARIREAYSRTAHQIRLAAQIHQVGGDDNGKRIGFIESSTMSCCSKQLKFHEVEINNAVVADDTMQHIEEMCYATKDALKTIPALTFSDYFTMRQNCKGLLIFPVLYFILVPGIYGIYVLVNEEPFDISSWVLPTTIAGTVLMVFVYIGFYFNIMFRKGGTSYKERTRKDTETIVWKMLKQHYKKSKCLIFYDTLPKEFVLMYLRNKFPEHADGSIKYELWADLLIECTIAYYSHDIIYWESLPKSSYNRHGIWKQRECICQLVEPHLGKLTLGECVWFTYLFKKEHKNFSNGTITYSRTIIL